MAETRRKLDADFKEGAVRLVRETGVADAGPGQAGFLAQQVNRKWYGDGTEIPTGQGKLYLASVMDMASRRILGHALGKHHDAASRAGRSWAA